MNLRNIAYFFITAISVIITLIYGRNLLIPFIFALLFWFVIREIRLFIDKSDFIRSKFPSWLKNISTSIIILLGLSFISSIINASIKSLSSSYQLYESNIDILILRLNETFDIDIFGLLQTHSKDIDFGKLLNSLFNSISNILSSTFIILIYAAFVFLEESNFKSKLSIIFENKVQYTKVLQILDNIEISVSRYLGLKAFVSFITGILSYFALLLIGVDAPIFWSLLIFIFNFIPTIGSLVGTIFPALFCVIQFGEFTQGILVLSIVGFIQVIIGNILEPKLMGNSMNISPLITIVSLSFWGALWGVTGMILSVPITVIIIIIFSQIPSTRNIAVLLSEKGKIRELANEN